MALAVHSIADETYGPFGLGKRLSQLKEELGDPFVGSAGFLPPGPTFKNKKYFLAFGFSKTDGPADLICVYRLDGNPLTDQEISKLLQANFYKTNASWTPCDSVPSKTLNIITKTSFRTYPGGEWWGLYIASNRAPPAFQPALLIMTDGFLRAMAKAMDR